MTVCPLAEMPRQVGRDRAGADPAAHAGDRDHAAALHDFRPTRRFRMMGPKWRATMSRVNRLEQIFLHAEDPRGVAIEVDVVELADQQDTGRRVRRRPTATPAR